MDFIEIEDYIFRISEIVKMQYNCYARLFKVWLRNEEEPYIFNGISEEEAHYFVKEMTKKEDK